MKKRLYPLASLVVAAGVGVYAWVSGGKFAASIPFLAFMTLALAWVAWILWRSAQALVNEPEAQEQARAGGKRRKELEREKQMLLKAIKELEFDHNMGKISDADFEEIGAQYRQRALRVMRQLDLASGVVDYKKLVERDLAGKVTAAESSSPPSASPPPSSPSPPSSPPSSNKRTCSCGVDNDVDADFCKKCGKPLAAEASA